jgi:hypothetical protein
VAWPSDLRSLQERFFALVTAPDGVEAGLARLGSAPGDLAAVVAGDSKLDEVGRVGVYADMYFDRLLDILRMDFPKLLAVLGEEAFAGLAADFLEAAPPAGFSLRDLGAPLPRFIESYPALSDRPWLAELARLEWTRVDVFDGPDSPVWTFEDLRSLPPDRFAELPLTAVPTHRLVTGAYAVEEVWRRIERGEPGGSPGPGPGPLLVWRKHTEVLHRRPAQLEAELIAELAGGTQFGLVCDRLGAGRSLEEAAGLAFQLLATWAEQGLLVRPTNELK